MIGKQLIKENVPLIGGVVAYKSYKNHAKTTTRRKKKTKHIQKNIPESNLI